MLNIETARKIGFAACIEKLGRDFLLANREYATSAFGECDDGVFCFIGVDNRCQPRPRENVIVLDNHSEFPYRVSCNVNLVDGGTSFVECILPT